MAGVATVHANSNCGNRSTVSLDLQLTVALRANISAKFVRKANGELLICIKSHCHVASFVSAGSSAWHEDLKFRKTVKLAR